ncbi:MAG: hypothetical protein JWN40_3714 [Phycisphaerales bacterium]|nr:hypothetical protein [Phycisphaerales bacterium]
MSFSYTCRLFRSANAPDFRRALEDVARSFGGQIEWRRIGEGHECLRLGSTPTVQTLYLPDGVCEWRLFEQLSEKVNAPVMELRIQQDVLWDYSLNIGSECVDTFSTLPQYWNYPEELDERESERWAGKPKLLAELWQVPLGRIERYFVNWGMEPDPDDSDVFNTVLKGKAYPGDQHPYGECLQMFDFLAALGGTEPVEGHRLAFVKWRE